MDVLSSMASGSTMPLPAMSAATCRAPCSKIATFCPMLAPGHTPGPPHSPATTASAQHNLSESHQITVYLRTQLYSSDKRARSAHVAMLLCGCLHHNITAWRCSAWQAVHLRLTVHDEVAVQVRRHLRPPLYLSCLIKCCIDFG